MHINQETCLDITSQVNLGALLCEESILIPIQSTRIDPDTIPVLAESDSLRANTEGIFHVDIVHVKIVFMDAKSAACVVGTCFPSIKAKLDRCLITLVGGSIGSVPIYLG